MGFNKKFFQTGGIVASTPPAAAAGLDPLQNFETVTYAGNGGTQKITGYIRKGAAFNGSSSYIELSDSISVATGNNDFSLSAWVYLNSMPSNFASVITTQANYYFYIFIASDGSVRTYNGSVEVNSSASVITTGQWYHIVATLDSTNGKNVYVNGTNVATSSDTSNCSSTSASNMVGVYDGGGINQYYLDGKIDQVRIFNRALDETTDGEVTTLYGETYASSTKSTTDIFGDGSGVALYQLDENANDTGRDFGQSAVFNGSSSEIDIPHNTEFDATGGLSISLWINKAVLDSSNDRIMDKANGGSGSYGWEMMYNSTNGYRLDVYDTSNSVSSARSGSSGISATGIWDHVVGTISSSGVVKLYVNGVLKDTTSALSGTISTNTGSVTIGRYYNAAGGCNAKFDQIRFFNAEIDQAAVDTLYAEYNISTTNLIAHYKLDGDATDEQGSYDGTASNVTYSDGVKFDGTATNVNFLGMAFQPDLVVIKNRETAGYEFTWFDSIRGALQRLRSDSTSGSLAEDTKAGSLTSFDTNGFSLGNYAGTNQDTKGHVAWCWRANHTTVTDSSTGDITADIRANTDAGFSIIKYTGNNTSGATVPHGLNSQPDLVFIKAKDSSNNWHVYVNGVTSDLQDFRLNSNSGLISVTSKRFVHASFTDSVIALGNSGGTNAAETYIGYCFHSVDGYQKIGSYTGDGGTNNAINLGFQPRFVMIKLSSHSGQNWYIMDSLRDNLSVEKALSANLTDAEESLSNHLDFTSTGFTLTKSSGAFNQSGYTYIYLAIA